MKGPKCIFIIDDHPLVTQGLESVLSATGWDAQVMSFTNETDMNAASVEHHPDLLIVDIQLRHADGRTIVRKIRAKWPDVKVIMLSSFEDPDIIRSAFAAGANAYMIKNASYQELLEGIEAAWNGRAAVQDQVYHALKDEPTSYQDRYPIQKIPRFTPREREILKLIIAEKTTREIAALLSISEKTVETHRTNLYLKLDVKNLAGLVKKAVSWGMA